MLWLRLARSCRFPSHGPRGWIAAAAAAVALTNPIASFHLFAAAEPPAPVYRPDALPPPLETELSRKSFKRDPKSGNYLAPKVLAKTPDESLVPVAIGATYVKDLRGRPVFLRQSIRAKLLAADVALFARKGEHIQVNYGFRSNLVQHELFLKLNGKSKVAPAGGSFHETGLALDINNWQSAQRFMIEAGFVGGCYGIEEDLVHYSIGEISKASDFEAFQRCTLKEIPEHILKVAKKAGDVDELKKAGKAGTEGIKKLGGRFGRLKK